MSKKIYTFIGWLSVVTIPVAPAYFFGEAVMKQAQAVAHPLLAIAVGFAAAVGMESVGIYAGHTAVQAFRLGRKVEGVAAALILAAYVGIGAYKLTGFGQTMFFVAPLSYLVLGVNYSVVVAEQKDGEAEADAKERADKERQAALDRQEKRDKLIAERQERLDQQVAEDKRLAHEERMAKIAAKTAATSRQHGGNMSQGKRQDNGTAQWDYTDWRLVPPEVKQKIATMTAPELAPIMPHLGDTTRRSWVRKAKAEYGNLPPNSPYVAEQGASGD